MKCSIIIPTIARDTLEACLNHLFLSKNFDQCEVEILVIYDGSLKSLDSKTRHWLQKITGNERIRLLETENKRGASGARNVGLDKASGALIAFLGDDILVAPDWLEKMIVWHAQHPATNQALLGKVNWTQLLSSDRFHVWLNDNAQFDFKSLDKGKNPTWRHFYTSNISLKREAIGKERFEEAFQGWGFEDIEFGYRLAQQGLKITYDSAVLVHHDDPQTFEGLLKRTRASRINAARFEQLHPGLKILPHGFKKLILKTLIVLLMPLVFIDQIHWWRAWKKAWIGA